MASLRTKISIVKYLGQKYAHLFRILIPGKWIGKVFFFLFEKPKILRASKPQNVKTSKPTFIGNQNFEFSTSTKVGILIHEKILRNNVWMEHEFAFAYKESLDNLGISAQIFDTDALDSQEVSTCDFTNLIKKNKITHLILLGDTLLEGKSYLSSESLLMMRKKENLIVCTVFMDCLETLNSEQMLGFWKGKADIFIIHHPPLEKYLKDQKYVLWPSLPYPESFFDDIGVKEKKSTLSIPGSGHRYRSDWARYSQEMGLAVNSQINTRHENSNNSFSIEDYFISLAEAKFIFTNGYRNRRESQVIAKTTEVMLVRSLLLYESGSQLGNFFTPYRHYIPVRNVSDLVEKTRFLQANQTIADAIIINGRDYLLDNYSSKKFWEKVLMA